MGLRTKGYLILIGIVIILEIVMMNVYIRAANEFGPYQLYDLFNFTRDNEFEGGVGLLLIAIIFQVFLGGYLVVKDNRTVK